MGRLLVAAAAMLATAWAPCAAQTVTVAPAGSSAAEEMQPLAVRVGGRVAIEPRPGGGRALVHEWPGVYFEAAFAGQSVVLRFDDPANAYRLHVDDLPPIALTQPGASDITIGGLTDRPHSLRLEKVTESIDLPQAFAGFYVPAAARPLPLAPPRARQIEFIGDSNMAGYGIRSDTRQCTKDEVRLLTDTQAAYPALVARRFDADYQVNAISGRGLIRNYAGEAPDKPLPAVYPRALPSREQVWRDPSWQPQVIVVGLYANDFSTPLKPGEKWASDAEFVAAFVAAYEPFLAELHHRAPDAAVLVVWPDFAGQPDARVAAEADAARRVIAGFAQALGVRTILFPVLPDLGLDRSACDYHGSLADHRKLETWLTAYLEAHPELWQGN